MNLFEETGVRGLATKLGLRYAGFASDEEYRTDTGGLPNLPLLAGVEQRSVRDLMYGRYNGANVQVFSVDVAPYEADPRNPDRSCAAVTFAASFPPIRISAHTPMSRLRQKSSWRATDHLPDAFKDTFVVEGDEEGVRSLIGPELADWLLHQTLPLRIEIQGGALLGHTPAVEDGALPELLDAVQGMHQRIPQDAWATYGLFRLA